MRSTGTLSGLVDVRLNVQEMKAAKKKIERRIVELEALDLNVIQVRRDPKIVGLEVTLHDLLVEIFGSNSTQYSNYSSITNLDRTPLVRGRKSSVQEIQEGVKKGVTSALSVLKAIEKKFAEDLDDSDLSQAAKPLRAYEGLDLHPEIERHVGPLYRNGHYAEAVEKSIKVLNNLVRLRSGEDSDGTPLMLKVFSKNSPILKFNDLADQSDQDEQQGFMYLYAGAVMGLRNPRAHKIIQDDAERSLEFVAFISLLAKMLDDASL